MPKYNGSECIIYLNLVVTIVVTTKREREVVNWMPLKIKAFSDFICPFCFLGKGPLDEIAKEKGIEIEWMPLMK